MTAQDTEEAPEGQTSTGGTTAVFSMKEAAQVAGVSVSTLRRRRTQLTAAGAHISPDGWQVPMTALIAAGLITGEGPRTTVQTAPSAPQPTLPAEATGQPQELAELTARLHELEHQAAEWRRRAEIAEARAEERGRALDALHTAQETERLALRMLTTGPTTPETARPASVSPPAAPTAAHPLEGPAPQTAPAAPPPQQPLQRQGFISRLMKL